MKTSKQLSVAVISIFLALICFAVVPAWSQSQKKHEQQERPQLGEFDHHGEHQPRHGQSTALRFTADGQYVLVPSTDEVDMISRGLTIEAWVKPEAGILSRGYSSIVSKQLNGTGYMLATNNRANTPNPGHSFKAEVDGIQVTSGSQPAIDGWQHVAAVWDDGQLKIYVNGQFDGVINTGSPIPNSFDLWIGSSPFGADTNWRGAIDEVRIWAVARTQEQIQSTMNQYLCGDERGLRAYWSFDEGQGEELRDTIGHSNGVISGPEWVPGVELARSEGCQDKLHRR